MLQKFPWKTAFLSILAWTLFWEVKGEMSRDRAFFLYRWIYSDMSYAKNLEVIPYLLTDDQVSQMLLHPDVDIQQPSKNELADKNVNVVLRIRNLDRGTVWGKLSWKMSGWSWKELDVPYIYVPEKAKKFSDIIIPMGVQITVPRDYPPNPIEVKWDELYVYC